MKKLSRTKILLTLSISIIALLFTAAPVKTAVSNQKAKSALKVRAKKRYKAAFDLAHNEIFSPLVEGPLHYSKFYKMIKKSGASMAVNKKALTPGSLSEFDAYVVAGPSKDFSPGELTELREFVNDGGSLLVLLHISGPVARLTEQFGIVVSNFVISEHLNTIKNKSQDFHVRDFSPHPVTRGLKEIAVFGTWGLMTEKGGAVVAKTSEKAWADLNRNRDFDKDEPEQSFGIIGVSEYGEGKVVVVADDAPFANLFIGMADNSKLARNIVRWFMERRKTGGINAR
ncbi:MAG: DUF4350 domain-containing protein [Thermodesulfobacteriota bacterium]